MRLAITILLALGLGLTACSKKKNHSTAYYPDSIIPLAYPVNGQYHVGNFEVGDRDAYEDFLFEVAYDQGYTGQDFADYIEDLSYAPAQISFRFVANNRVTGNWTTYDSNPGSDLNQSIPFDGSASKLADGRYMIEANGLTFITTADHSSVYINDFEIFFDDNFLGYVTVQ